MHRSVLFLSLDLAAGCVRAGDGSDKITVRELLCGAAAGDIYCTHRHQSPGGRRGAGTGASLVSTRFATDGVFILQGFATQ